MRIEPFFEPYDDRGQKALRLLRFALANPEPRQARRNSQLQRLGLLALGDCEALLESGFA